MNIHLGYWLIPTIISIICVVWAAILNHESNKSSDVVSLLIGGTINLISIGVLMLIAVGSWAVYFGLALFFK